ncbi:peptidase C15 [Ancylobacter sp. MQZ15Z-1]|uniref:Pyrrolidone-carboxylate peptidase n=1 Tax=Ancylobacter mangrovi TaxID=2972472 RepID=A0A9X2PC82_9HYPH|nr:peptidase C15 [Ancylobacter mangrovi]MCS0494236.1 peptidase C15 [Ancylobacter mangrovi]
MPARAASLPADDVRAPAPGHAPRILITGFGRFPGAPANPSGPLARALARSRRLGVARAEALVLPTLWDEAARFAQTLDRLDPDIVLMVGLAGRRSRVGVETLGRCATGLFPDAGRRRPAARRLAAGGAAPDVIGCAAAGAPLLHALRQAGVPACGSRDAGRYVCNALAYAAYGWARRRGRIAVFIHIPRPHPGRLSAARLETGLEAVLVGLLAQHRAGRLTAAPGR